MRLGPRPAADARLLAIRLSGSNWSRRKTRTVNTSPNCSTPGMTATATRRSRQRSLRSEWRRIIDPQGRGRQYIASRLATLTGTRSAGFVLTRQEAAGVWGAATYSLRRTVPNGDDGKGHRDHRDHRPPMPPISPMTPMPDGPSGANGDGEGASGEWEAEL